MLNLCKVPNVTYQGLNIIFHLQKVSDTPSICTVKIILSRLGNQILLLLLVLIYLRAVFFVKICCSFLSFGKLKLTHFLQLLQELQPYAVKISIVTHKNLITGVIL